MSASEISQVTPLPVFVTNGSPVANGTLPEIFKVGKHLNGQSLGSPRFTVEIKRVQGDWIMCDYAGDFAFHNVWIHVPSLADLWSEVESPA